ncbi:hypothetical protein B0H14DRAFT_3446030 [Mycena olivaceomarginata]|nr:hypothetical protein B0H14DRAFT_3446030 [Mycena olivaceomarginata]
MFYSNGGALPYWIKEVTKSDTTWENVYISVVESNWADNAADLLTPGTRASHLSPRSR